jgi:hypothetical protein
MIATSIDGEKLKFYFYQSPVGDAKYSGPKLELASSSFSSGDYCGDAAPAVIPPDGFADIIGGDSKWGQSAAAFRALYKVYKPDGALSKCALELFMNEHDGGSTFNPIYTLEKTGDCSDVPTLKIFKLKTICGAVSSSSTGCIKDKRTGIYYSSTGFNVYFDGETTAQAASIGNFTASPDVAEAPSGSQSEPAESENETAATVPAVASDTAPAVASDTAPAVASAAMQLSPRALMAAGAAAIVAVVAMV